jgi:hypothetical protein
MAPSAPDGAQAMEIGGFESILTSYFSRARFPDQRERGRREKDQDQAQAKPGNASCLDRPGKGSSIRSNEFSLYCHLFDFDVSNDMRLVVVH